MAHFNVKYPDDITDWKTFAVAITADRQTGSAAGHVRAFKPLSANLSLPNFLVAGDEAHVIGKVLNYTPDTVAVERSFSVNGKTTASGRFSLLNAHIDTFTVIPQSPDSPFRAGATNTDSLHLLYTIKKDDYLDGEERSISVYPTGVKETKGIFSILEGDTSIRLTFDTALGPVHVYASASLLPYQAQLPAGRPMDVSESGKLPVYFTAYQQFQNKTPEKVSGTFAVRSWFVQDGATENQLRACKPATLQVEVDAKGDADYVLVEIPIPALHHPLDRLPQKAADPGDPLPVKGAANLSHPIGF